MMGPRGGAAGREIAGHERCRDQDRGRERKCQRIRSAHAKKQSGDEPGQSQRGGEADDNTDQGKAAFPVLRTSFRMSRGSAPSDIRMPNSCVRDATEYAITP